MSTNDQFRRGNYDELGLRQGRWGEPMGIVMVEHGKPGRQLA